MKRSILLGLIFTTVIAAWAAEKIQPLNVKLGLWENTMTMTTSGQMPIPSEYLSKLTPEQRARIEARMKAQSAGSSRATTTKSCLTQEELDRDYAPGLDKKKCSFTILSSTSSKVVAKLDCAEQEMKYGGMIEFDAISPENVKGSGHITATGANHTMNSSYTITSKWIGADCGNVK